MINVPIDFSFIEKYKDKIVPWGPVGYITYKRTYARKLDSGKTEEWWQTVGRCVKGIVEINGYFTQEEIEKLYDHVFNLRCCFSGRALWQLGTSTVTKYGSDSLQNCWFVNVDEIESFPFTMNELMLGGGVGFSVRSKDIYRLPKVRHAEATHVDSYDVDFIVPDNREGWVDLLRKVMKAYFDNGRRFSYSTRCIRTKGKEISSFGGVSSGPEELIKGISDICAILNNKIGQRINSVDGLDIMNIIGRIVVAGNVRRSAELAIGDGNDLGFMRAKRWDLAKIPNWRAMSNNSIDIADFNDIPEIFWEGYYGNGEPYGLVNTYNAKRFGRIIDGTGYRIDNEVEGFNPCAEISLESKESCNLAEIFLPYCRSLSEVKEVAELMYKVTKTISCWPFIDKDTNEITSRNHRLGIGVTGIYQSDYDEMELSTVYNHIEEVDRQYSKIIGVGASIKLTTVKPSGTLSLLPGVTSGAHPAFAQHCIRRIRFSSNSVILQACIKAGYHAEEQKNFDGTTDPNVIVVDFPVAYNSAVTSSEISAIDQLEKQLDLQTYWADNAVSITVYYRPEELDDIKKFLKENYNENFKSVSFLRHSEHGFDQAPLEEISYDKYLEMLSKVTPITKVNEDTSEELMDAGCDTGVCPIR